MRKKSSRSKIQPGSLVDNPIYEKYKEMNKTFRSFVFLVKREYEQRYALYEKHYSHSFKHVPPIIYHWLEHGVISHGRVRDESKDDLRAAYKLNEMYRTGESKNSPQPTVFKTRYEQSSSPVMLGLDGQTMVVENTENFK